MKDIFYELIKEAKEGKVIIDDQPWNYSFNTVILDKNKEKLRLESDENLSTLMIKNENSFFKLLEEYIDLELSTNRKSLRIDDNDKVKLLICNLFANATPTDFLNPEMFIKRYIHFLKDDTFSYLDNSVEVDASSILKDSSLIIKRENNSTMNETPYKMCFSLKDKDNNIYEFPSIYYGIDTTDNKRCYIYGIQASKHNDHNNKFNKKVNRLLYKINNGVKDTKEYYDYKEGKTDIYPENNISDVTMSFIFSLNLFISLLQSENIEEVKAVTYLPMRYNSRDLAAKRNNNEEFNERNKMIQNNLTNKFIRTFRRLEYQNNNMKITSYPYSIDEFLNVRLKPKAKEINNELLEETRKII